MKYIAYINFNNGTGVIVEDIVKIQSGSSIYLPANFDNFVIGHYAYAFIGNIDTFYAHGKDILFVRLEKINED